MPERLPLNMVVALAEAGETFTLEVGDVPVEDLLLLASVIGGSDARVRFRNVQERSLEDLMRITVAGRGRVHLDAPATVPLPPPTRRTGWFRRRAPLPVGRAA